MLKRIRSLANSAAEDSPKDFGITDPPSGGTYVGWYVEDSCASRILEWCFAHGLDPIPPSDLHTTIIYSKGKSLAPKKHGLFPLQPYRVIPADVPRSLERFGPEHQALVVRFAEFTEGWLRHQSLLEAGLQHTYPDAHAHFHMTLTYTAGNVDPGVMADLARNPIPFPIVFDREKVNPIKDTSYA